MSQTQTADDAQKTSQELEGLSFESALGELEQIVRALETGRAPLEESIGSYERGVALKQHCEKKLKEAQTKIEKITLDSDGNISAEPMDDDTI